MTNDHDDDVLHGEGLSQDAFFGGRITLTQPKKGFRATTDALLLAAAIPEASHNVLELGGGVGAASLALAARCPEMMITAVERDAMTADLLRRNISDNAMEGRVAAIEGDAFNLDLSGPHDVVMINPPYNEASSTLSRNDKRKAAMAESDLSRWIKAGHDALAPKGRLVMITRADRLDEVMTSMDGRFGDLSVLAVHARADRPAKRVLISGRKGVGGPMAILPPLITHDDDGALSHAMKTITLDGAAVDMIAPGRDVGSVKFK